MRTPDMLVACSHDEAAPRLLEEAVDRRGSTTLVAVMAAAVLAQAHVDDAGQSPIALALRKT